MLNPHQRKNMHYISPIPMRVCIMREAMYSRDARIHLCAMMVYVCTHMYGMIRLLLSYSCV